MTEKTDTAEGQRASLARTAAEAVKARPFAVAVWPGAGSAATPAIRKLLSDLSSKAQACGMEPVLLRATSGARAAKGGVPDGMTVCARAFARARRGADVLTPEAWVLASADCVVVADAIAPPAPGNEPELPPPLLPLLARGISVIAAASGPEAATICWQGFGASTDLLAGGMEDIVRAYPQAAETMLRATAHAGDADAVRADIDAFAREELPSVMLRVEYPLLMLLTIGRRPKPHELRPRRHLGGGSRSGDMVSGLARQADAMAVVYGQKFRSSYVGRFALSAIVAVAAALVVLILPTAKPVAFALQFAATLTIILSYLAATRGRWQDKWLERRFLAERLRLVRDLPQIAGEMLLGRQTRIDLPFEWSDILVDRAARAALLDPRTWEGEVERRLDAGLDAALAEQIDYQATNIENLALMERRLGKTGISIFVLSMSLATVSAVLAVVLPDLMDRWSRVIVALLAFLPAFGAAIFGIRVQGSFKADAARSKRILDRLKVLRDGKGGEQSPGMRQALARAKRFVDIQALDISTWRDTQAARSLDLP